MGRWKQSVRRGTMCARTGGPGCTGALSSRSRGSSRARIRPWRSVLPPMVQAPDIHLTGVMHQDASTSARRRPESSSIWRSSVRVSTRDSCCALRHAYRDADLAEDLAQETLSRTVEKWDHIRAVEKPEDYVFRIAFNLGRSWWRRRCTERRARVTTRRRDRVVRSRSDRRPRGPPRRLHAHATTTRGDRDSVLPRTRCQRRPPCR